MLILKKNYKTFLSLHKAIQNYLVLSVHDLSENGLAGSLSEMAFSGNIGAVVQLKKVICDENIKFDYQVLFSESNSRFLVEVDKKNQDAFEKNMKDVDFAVIGYTQRDTLLEIFGLQGNKILLEKLSNLKKAWKTDKVFK